MAVVKSTYPKRFEIYRVNLDPNIGAEVKKTRPCVIISPDSMNQGLKTVLVAPMATTLKKWPFRIAVTHKKVNGQIMLDQIRAVSKKRLHKMEGTISTKVRSDVLKCLNNMFIL